MMSLHPEVVVGLRTAYSTVLTEQTKVVSRERLSVESLGCRHPVLATWNTLPRQYLGKDRKARSQSGNLVEVTTGCH